MFLTGGARVEIEGRISRWGGGAGRVEKRCNCAKPVSELPIKLILQPSPLSSPQQAAVGQISMESSRLRVEAEAGTDTLRCSLIKRAAKRALLRQRVLLQLDAPRQPSGSASRHQKLSVKEAQRQDFSQSSEDNQPRGIRELAEEILRHGLRDYRQKNNSKRLGVRESAKAIQSHDIRDYRRKTFGVMA